MSFQCVVMTFGELEILFNQAEFCAVGKFAGYTMRT